MNKSIEINGHKIGPGQPVYVVAEISANHNQKYEEAVKLVHAAKEVGADAVKIQTYTADTMTLPCATKYFQIGKGTIWEGKNLYELYQEAHTPWDWQPQLKKEAEKIGIDLFSSAFDDTAIDFLEDMGVPAHKVASFELVDISLIERMAKTGKPLIISTGMASLEEIEEALTAARKAGAQEIVLMKCTSAYPAPPEEMNLRSIPDMMEKFKVPVGLSDHTIDKVAAISAVALGACMIEKHLTLSRSVKGPDSEFSLEPEEFRSMVQAIRECEKALGKVSYGANERESHSLRFRRSLFVVEDVKEGEALTHRNLRAIRPGDGLAPKYFEKVLGKKLKKSVSKGTPLSWELVE